MNPTARKLTALSLAAVMGLGLAACSGGSGNGDATGTASPTPGTTAEPTSYADQIVVGITAEPKYIEPNAPGEGLLLRFRCPSRFSRALPAPATTAPSSPSWLPITISDDGLTYTFNLVQGVKFPLQLPMWSPATGFILLHAPDHETPGTPLDARPGLMIARPPTSRWSSSPETATRLSWAASTWCWATSPVLEYR